MFRARRGETPGAELAIISSAMSTLTTHSAIDEITPAEWNRLADPDIPFLRHEFLAAMERHGCVGEVLGWIPHHLALRDEEDVATMSTGEGRYRQGVVVPEGAPEFEEAERESSRAAEHAD